MNDPRCVPGGEPRLSELFPDTGYRFQMRFKRGRIADFFEPSHQGRDVLAERARWLERAASDCAVLLPEAEPALHEALGMLSDVGVLPAIKGESGPSNSLQLMVDAGRRLEPDILLLMPSGESSEFQLVAGCVCFPSGWCLADKIGRPLVMIHGPVPGLNQQLAGPISQFLRRMEPGIAWRRENWGLSRSPELNHHPNRQLPRLDPSVTIDEVWLRVERQALVSLPRSGCVLFGIRVEVYPLEDVKMDVAANNGLKRALESMPEPVAEYKGLSSARTRIIALLNAVSS